MDQRNILNCGLTFTKPSMKKFKKEKDNFNIYE